MLLVCALATLAVLFGAALGMSPLRRAETLRTVQAAGLGAGVVAVFLSLLPEAAEEIGGYGLIPFAITFGFAGALERVLHARSHDTAKKPLTLLDLGVAALALHQALEGLAMGAVDLVERREGVSLLARAGTLFAMVAHTVPIVAVLTLALARVAGLRAALLRVALLTAASASGALLVAFPRVEALLVESSGWIHGGVAGLLLHAVLHAALPVRRAAINAGRGYELVGFTLGALLVLAAIVAHGSLAEMANGKTALVVVCGFAMAAVGHLAWPHAAHDEALETT
jgi:zinc transporter ZupT